MPLIKPLILLIEDDPQFRLLLTTTLENQAFPVLALGSGIEGLAAAHARKPGLLLLDLGLPDMDGQDLISQLRKNSDMPIIVLSARNQESDITQALDNGADDFLTKPFNAGELISRMNALLRRVGKPVAEDTDVFRTGELKIDFGRRRVFVGSDEIHLTPLEFKLLSLLAQNAGFVLTHRQLLAKVWGASHIEHYHYLRIYMGQLRHKLEKDPARPRYLLTETGVGYRLNDSS